MNRPALRHLLAEVGAGTLPVDDALSRLAAWPGEELGYAHVDTQRAARTGDPEVIYGEGKEAPHIAAILGRLHAAGQEGLATRVDPDKAQAVLALLREEGVPEERLSWHRRARLLHLRSPVARTPIGRVLVVCAGTSDLPVADEAALVAEALGARVDRLTDVGVAGIHRVLGKAEVLRAAHVVIVVAGMEGALASVVAGLVASPVIAVPTSVGYGAAFGGLAALLGMLNSCAAGVSVVNIDNGFGAALQAVRINRLAAGGGGA
ncbi:nickel pincer cofactor biosynthesis protein LarB [Myxococcota bacterium]|nr:nickel pincer cofactor biosynthesis protein LarB [Myxococcota bacterium]